MEGDPRNHQEERREVRPRREDDDERCKFPVLAAEAPLHEGTLGAGVEYVSASP